MNAANSHQSDVHHDMPWQIAVFAARESVATLVEAVQAIAVACADHAARIDILVNGNRQLAQALAQHFKTAPNSAGGGVRLCIWFVELGDKAQTWNVYVHRLYQGNGLAFFIDGYARPEANSLNELALALSDDGHALAATGVPSCGRSADKLSKVMQHSGGIHGNLFALTSRAMDQIRRRGFRLPLGLYRTDALIGAAVNFGFDSASNEWDPSRIRVQPSATWQFKTLQWWRLGDLKTHLKRMGRQAQGELENLAVRDHLARRRQSPETLPTTAQDLVLQWWQGENRPPWGDILRHPAWLLAIRRLREGRDWSTANQNPELVFQKNDTATNSLNSEAECRKMSSSDKAYSPELVYVVILNWNGWQDTINCLQHLFKSQGCGFVVVVCDNGSTNGSVDHIVDWIQNSAENLLGRKPICQLLVRADAEHGGDGRMHGSGDLVLVDNEANLGFAGGCNVGIRYALRQRDCSHVWLLNNDTVVPPDSLAALVNTFKTRPGLGLCGSQVRFLERQEIVQSFGGVLNGWFCTTHTLCCGFPSHKLKSEPKKIDFVHGASMMASRAFLESVGLMHEEYFLYFEEVDWAERAKGKFEIAVCINSLVYHAGGASIGSPGEAGERGLRSEYYLLRGRLMFARRFYPYRLWSVYLGFLASVFTRVKRRQWNRVRIALCVIAGRVPKALLDHEISTHQEKVG